MSMNALSQHVLAVANRKRMTVTNLQLQKVMYFAIRDYLENHTCDSFIHDVYDRPFESWQYGPVEPDIYYRYSQYGSTPIDDMGKYVDTYHVFDKSIVSRLQADVFDLVNESHEQGFWQDNFEKKHIRASYRLTDIANG